MLTSFTSLISYYASLVADFLMTAPFSYITVALLSLFVLSLLKSIMKGW